MKASVHNSKKGFTIVELIVVIVVIGILSAIGIVGYGAWQSSLAEAGIKSDLLNASAAVEDARNFNNTYPLIARDVFNPGENVTMGGGATQDGDSFCISAVHEDGLTDSFYISKDTLGAGPLAGACWNTIAAAQQYNCSILYDRAYCWGTDDSGVLGNGASSNSLLPVAVDTSGVLSGKRVTDIATTNFRACAIADGQAFCWGSGFLGTLGNGSTADSPVPVAVDTSGVLAGKTVTDISVGYYISCAIADGQAFCWGQGSSIGVSGSPNSSVPVAVDTSGVLAGKTVTDISVGFSHACAVADGQAFCWGSRTYGGLGDGSSSSSSPIPVAVNTSGVLSGRTVTVISAESYHTCAVADGQAFCWGDGAYGNLGNGNIIASNVPVAVDTSGVLSGRTVTDVSDGRFHTCAVADGLVFCWGYGGYGGLGNNGTENSSVPVSVDVNGILSGRKLSTVSSGTYHTCVASDGLAACWGNGFYGTLGNNSDQNFIVPVAVVNPFEL